MDGMDMGRMGTFSCLRFPTKDRHFFPPWEQNIPSLGMKCSHTGNKQVLLVRFDAGGSGVNEFKLIGPLVVGYDILVPLVLDIG